MILHERNIVFDYKNVNEAHEKVYTNSEMVIKMNISKEQLRSDAMSDEEK